MKINWGTFLRVFVSAVALFLIVWLMRDKLGQAFTILRTEVKVPFFCLAALFYFLSILALSIRMQFILHFKKIFFGFFQSLYLCYMGIFFSMFLPSAIGGDVMRAVYLAPYARKKADIFSCLVMDRLAGFCIVIFFTLVSASLLRESWNPVPVGVSLACLILFSIACLSVLIRPEWIPWIFSKLKFLPHKLQDKLNQFYDSLTEFFHSRSLLLGSVGISLVAQTLFVTSYYFLGVSLDSQIPWATFFILVPMITIISMAPSVGGAGVRELGAAALFANYMPDERAAALTMLLALMIYLNGILGGIWYLLRGHREHLPRPEASLPSGQNS